MQPDAAAANSLISNQTIAEKSVKSLSVFFSAVFTGGGGGIISSVFAVVVFIAACLWWKHMMNKD